MPRVTDRLVKSLAPPTARSQSITYDDELKGFGVRVTKNGARSFILNYHVNGRERRITIGAFPNWSVSSARAKAAEYRRATDVGVDPLAEKAMRRSERTVAELWRRYEAEILPTKATKAQPDERAMWARWILPQLGQRSLSSIDYSDIERLHRSVSVETPVRANRVLASLRHGFNLAIRWKLCISNPTVGIRKNPEEPRQRYLTEDELYRVITALDKHPQRVSADAIKFLLLTGCRRGEALQAKWDHFDLDRGIWQKPSAHTKQRRVHRVPLSKAAVELLQKRKRNGEKDWVFPGTNDNALTDVKRTWSSVRKNAGCADVRLHDLRHTFASLLVSSGRSLPTVGAMLGHTQPQTTARYAHLLDQPLREAAEAVSKQVLRSANEAA